MRLDFSIFRPLSAWLIAIAGTALLTAGPRAAVFLPAMLATGPVAPAGPITEEEEERHESHAKLAATDRRSHERPAGAGRTPASRARLPIPAAAKPAPSHSTTHHESDLRNGLGAPLQC